MKKRTFVFLTALLLALCMLTLVACGDKGREANNEGGDNSQAGDSDALFPDGASIEEVISILESGDVKITSFKCEGYDMDIVKKPKYEVGFSNNKLISHMKAYGFIENFVVYDFNALFVGYMVRVIDERGQVFDENGEPIGTMNDESLGWTVSISVKADNEKAFIDEISKNNTMFGTDIEMRKINSCVISLIKEQKGLKEDAFSCKDNILIFDKDEIYSKEEEGQTSISWLQNIKKIYDFNVPIELPEGLEEAIEAAKKGQEK